MTKTKTDSNQVSIHQHQDYTVKWCQIQNGKQKWIVIKRPFLVEINGHGNICNKLGVVGKGLTMDWKHKGFSTGLLNYPCYLLLVHPLLNGKQFQHFVYLFFSSITL